MKILVRLSLIFVLLGEYFSTSLAALTKADDVSSLTISEQEIEAPRPAQYHWSLAEVLKIAENQNPDFKTARFNFEAASKTILQATSEYLPHVSVDAHFDKTTLPSPSAGASDQLGVLLPYTNAVAKVRQMLFDFGKGMNDIGAAQANGKSAEREMESVHDLVQLWTTEAFFQVLLTEKLVGVSAQGVEKFREVHRRADALVRAGTRPSFDLTQASLELSQARLRLVEATNTRDLARVAFLNLIGMQSEVRFNLEEPPPSELLNLKTLKLEDLTSRAVVSRPEVRQSEFALESVRMQTHSAAKEYFPTISLEGWYGKYFANYPSVIADSYGGGITINWSLFDGMKTTGRMGELSALYEARYAGLEKQRENIVADVAKNYAQIKRATDYLSLVQENLNAARENGRLAKRRYESGVGTFLELLVANTSLLSAEATAVQSRYQYEIALADLKHAVKAPLEEHHE